jgi:tRNA modification GTPase
MNAREDQTIIAQCTPQGSGALALLRICGLHAIDLAEKIARLPKEKALDAQASHTIHFGNIVSETGQIIDQVMFLLMRAPKTFTGQNTVEITCHNNPFIIHNIIHEAIQHGARIAERGEFAQRAVLNNKIDITQAEAINDVIHANTQFALKKSLAQVAGSMSQWIQTIEKDLLKALAWSEASFEFLDDEGDFAHEITQFISVIQKNISTIRATYESQKQIREGIRIALVGSVNAGKSSIFNQLLNHDRSIVTDIAGTTRDSVEAGLYRNGTYWTLIDTAGLRKTGDIVEQEGVKRSYNEAKKADIVILVLDGARGLSAEEKEIYNHLLDRYYDKTIFICNKSDHVDYRDYTHNFSAIDHIVVSGNCDQLEQHISEKINTLLTNAEAPFMLNQRQANILQSVEKQLTTIYKLLCHNDIAYELVAYHIKNTLEDISQLSGKSISEHGMDTVFKEFCVGK